ncbi:MAG TPA: YihY/virulence factor BrkB family protein [Burkholderiales bacterium]|nr:YihY/virulence factor BrkB family protein [Burkholderiales bacterium]
MSSLTHRLLQWTETRIWRAPGASQSRAQAWLTHALRLTIVLARDLALGQLTLRAMGLVYTTLLSIVPLLAISFSVLKAFGVSNQIRPVLLGFLQPLGDKGVEITMRITEFIDNINGGVLGSVGLALLLYTSVSLAQKIEEAFNFIWHVSRPRSIGERFSRYVSALLVGPLLVFSALGLTAAAANLAVVREALRIEAIGWLASQATHLVPYALVIGAFAFLYAFMPNTRVRSGPAIAGAFVGGVAWQSAGWAFAQFVVTSTKYSAIYSSFAILILFMLWLYLSWLILLFGADVSFYVQHPEYVVKKSGEPRLSSRLRERLALVIMSLIARQHLEGREAWSADALAHELHVPVRAVDGVLTTLQARGMLAATATEPCTWLPARALDVISTKEVIDAVRAAGEEGSLSSDTLSAPATVDQLMQRYEQAAAIALRGISIRDLAASLPAASDGEHAWTKRIADRRNAQREKGDRAAS